MNSTFPVLQSTLSETDLAVFIQEKYKLSSITSCKIFRAAMNHVYMITDDTKKYVFRVYTHNWRNKLEIEEEMRFLLHLKDHNCPVAFPIRDAADKLIQELNAPEGLRYGVLFSFADGQKSARFSAETSFYIGKALAQVHQLSENFSLQRISYSKDVLLKDSLIRTQAFFTKNSEELQYLGRLADFLGKKFDEVDTQDLRFGAVHMDVWFDNMHFTDQNAVCLFDFDFCGNGYLSLDVSYFLYQLFSTNLNENDYKEKAEQFLKGYESIHMLSQAEKDFLPYACLAVMNYYLSMQCDRFAYWTNIFLNEDHLKRFVAGLKRWIIYNKIEMNE
ncbi:MAG: phosphotransferase [Bacteroidia bacterium]